MSDEFKNRKGDSMSAVQGSDNIELLKHRIVSVEGAIVKLSETNETISASLETLIRLEVRYDAQQASLDRTVKLLADIEQRVQNIERRVDFWNRSSSAVWVGLIGAFVLVVGFMWEASQTINAQRDALDQYRQHMLEVQKK